MSIHFALYIYAEPKVIKKVIFAQPVLTHLMLSNYLLIYYAHVKTIQFI